MVEEKKTESRMGLSQSILVGLLVFSAFIIGSLYTKVQYLEKGNKQTGTTPGQVQLERAAALAKSKYNSFDEAMLAIVKSLKMDDKKFTACLGSSEKKKIVEADSSQGASVGVNGTPAFFINGRLIPGAVPFSEFKKVVDEELSGKADSAITRSNVVMGGAATRGKSGAPVAIVEFSDFQCPFCLRVQPTLSQVLKEYEGKVMFAFKHFPLITLHPHAQKAAEAAECAKDQGKFWEFHDKLFETQSDWASI